MLLYEFVIVGRRHTTTLLLVQRPQSTPESNGHGPAPLIVHVDPIPVSTTAEQCMAEPDRPELDHVLFGVARDLIVRGDSPPDLPRGWDRLRRQIRPGRRSFFTARASSERLTTDALDWWKSFAEGRIDVTEHLSPISSSAPQATSHREPRGASHPQQQPFHDATLCPVRAWAALVKRVLGYPSTNSDTPVNAFVVNGVLKYIPATRTVDKIRASATVIGERTSWAAIPLNSDHTPFAAEQQWQCV